MTDNKKPQNRPNRQNRPKQSKSKGGSKSSRGAAIRASRRSADTAHKLATRYQPASDIKIKKRANKIDDSDKLKIIGLGGMDGGGSKNMMLLEYKNDAIIIDCGNDLGVDLPGSFGDLQACFPVTTERYQRAQHGQHTRVIRIKLNAAVGRYPKSIEIPAEILGHRQ